VWFVCVCVGGGGGGGWMTNAKISAEKILGKITKGVGGRGGGLLCVWVGGVGGGGGGLVGEAGYEFESHSSI